MLKGGAAILTLGFVMVLLGVFWFGRPDNGAPTITAVFPVPGAVAVPGNTTIQVSFDRPLAGDTGAMTVHLKDADGERIGGALEIHSKQTAVMLTPSAALVPGSYQAQARIGGGAPTTWDFTVSDNLIPGPPADGPILLITSDAVPFGDYYAEILRAEGLTSFAETSLTGLTRETLFRHQVAILSGEVTAPEQLALLKAWLEQGGNLIAIRPTGALASLAGLQPSQATLEGGYLGIDISVPPGQGLVGQTIQFHGSADIAATTPDTVWAASLYSDATHAASAPALTVRPVSAAGGEIAAFTFDLAQSVALTRQGNPKWAGQERDGIDPIRPNELFYGGTTAGAPPDYLDMSKVAIPQADEQMRLLSNLIAYLMRDTAPLPKFWYFPKGAKAVLVMAADDHGTHKGTEQSFDRMLARDPKGCAVAQWECARATSWMYASTGMGDSQAADYRMRGFDLGAHVTTYCHNWSIPSLTRAFFEDLHDLKEVLPSLGPQTDSRLHCIVWSDYVSQPRIERALNIRYDMNYYYWPKPWIDGRAGFMTGSGLPMRFADKDGKLIDVYQQETHLVDEVFADTFTSVAALIDRALGPEGYYGAFGTHYDFSNEFDVELMALAAAKDLPMVSARQMLDWTDARNGSTIGNAHWAGNVLSFEVHADPASQNMLEGMLPLHFANARLKDIRRGDETIGFDAETIKGIDYGLFKASSGAYTAHYALP